MDTTNAIAFLDEAARYFETRSTGDEDRAYWSNVYNAKNCRDIAALIGTIERRGAARAIEIVRETRDEFLSEHYAVGQPAASFNERFACDQAASAIENEFGLGTIEQCRLLGKPTPFEVYSASQGAPDGRAS